jgi:uncharacterized MAPEG superfamily protein
MDGARSREARPMIATEPLSVLQRLARLEERAEAAERREREVASALLAYVQADIASLGPANRLAELLAELLVERLK